MLHQIRFYGRFSALRLPNRPDPHALSLPESMNFSDDHRQTVGFFDKFETLALIKPPQARVDFPPLKYVSAAAALVLAANLDRWRLRRRVRLSVIDYDKWDSLVRIKLGQLGLFDLLDPRNPPPAASYGKGLEDTTQTLIRFKSGNTTTGESVRDLRVDLEEITGQKLERKLLFRALSEAMTNVSQHAYPEEDATVKSIMKMWWLSGSYNASNQKLSVQFYDHGIGIPASLPRKHGREKISQIAHRFGFSNDDAGLIRASLEIARTRSGERHKGKGMDDVIKYARNSSGGYLRIISGRGEYELFTNGVENTKTHSLPLMGTLIQWELQL